MVKAREELRLAAKALDLRRVFPEVTPEDLDGDFAIQTLVARAVHRPHGTAADLGEEAVALDLGLGGLGRHPLHDLPHLLFAEPLAFQKNHMEALFDLQVGRHVALDPKRLVNLHVVEPATSLGLLRNQEVEVFHAHRFSPMGSLSSMAGSSRFPRSVSRSMRAK